MDLIDYLGQAFGGPAQQGDLQSQMLQQLGADPAAMRRAAGIQALQQFGATMLANSGPSLQPHGFAPALGQGLLAGQQAMGDAQGRSINSLSQLEGMKRAQAADAEQQRKTAAAQALQAKMADPDFRAQLPPELHPFADMLQNLPPEQAVSMIEHATSTAAANTRQDKQMAAANDRQDKQIAAQNTLEDKRLQRSLSAQAAAASRLPPELALLSPAEQADAVRTRYGLTPKAGSSPDDKAIATQTAKRIGEVDAQTGKMTSLLDQIDALNNGFTTHTYDTGNMLQRGYNSVASQAARSDKANVLDKSTQQLVLDTLSSMKNIRGSNMLTNVIERSKPGVGLSNEANMKVLADMRGPIAKQLADLQAERDHYANGGTIRTWKPVGANADMAGGAAATAPAAPPAGATPPPGAVKGADGRWYNPTTGRAYVWQPGG